MIYMNKKVLFNAVIAGFLIALPYSALADTNTQTTNPIPAAGVLAIPPLLQHILDAKQQLQIVALGHTLVAKYKTNKKKVKVLTGYAIGTKDAALAVFDPNSNHIGIVKGTLSGQKFSFGDSYYALRQIGFNGVNTRFQVTTPAGGIVVALKYLLSNPDSGSQTAIEAGLQPVIYTPNSPELNTNDLAIYGGQYLDSVMNTVAFELSYVQSVSVPGEKLTDAIKPAIIKALIYAEHTNTSEFSDSTANIQDIINQLNVSFAIDQADTFKYSVSTSGARGISQFIPSTYNGVVARHPNANLIPDATIGLSDQVNSIKAEYLLMDDYIVAVHARVASDFNPAFVYDYGAASYNGGVARVAKAVETFGANWDVDHAAETANLQTQINGQQAGIKTLKSQISKALGATKKDLNAQLATESSTLADLKNQLASIKTSALHGETISYLNKMHKLITIFNS